MIEKQDDKKTKIIISLVLNILISEFSIEKKKSSLNDYKQYLNNNCDDNDNTVAMHYLGGLIKIISISPLHNLTKSFYPIIQMLDELEVNWLIANKEGLTPLLMLIKFTPICDKSALHILDKLKNKVQLSGVNLHAAVHVNSLTVTKKLLSDFSNLKLELHNQYNARRKHSSHGPDMETTCLFHAIFFTAYNDAKIETLISLLINNDASLVDLNAVRDLGDSIEGKKLLTSKLKPLTFAYKLLLSNIVKTIDPNKRKDEIELFLQTITYLIATAKFPSDILLPYLADLIIDQSKFTLLLSLSIVTNDQSFFDSILPFGNQYDINYSRNNAKEIHPILVAAEIGNTYFVRQLIKKGAEINYSYKDGTTPLTIAAENGHEEIVAILIDHDADLSEMQNPGIKDPLISALREEKFNCAWLILHALTPQFEDVAVFYSKETNLMFLIEITKFVKNRIHNPNDLDNILRMIKSSDYFLPIALAFTAENGKLSVQFVINNRYLDRVTSSLSNSAIYHQLKIIEHHELSQHGYQLTDKIDFLEFCKISKTRIISKQSTNNLHWYLDPKQFVDDYLAPYKLHKQDPTLLPIGDIYKLQPKKSKGKKEVKTKQLKTSFFEKPTSGQGLSIKEAQLKAPTTWFNGALTLDDVMVIRNSNGVATSYAYLYPALQKDHNLSEKEWDKFKVYSQHFCAQSEASGLEPIQGRPKIKVTINSEGYSKTVARAAKCVTDIYRIYFFYHHSDDRQHLLFFGFHYDKHEVNLNGRTFEITLLHKDFQSDNNNNLDSQIQTPRKSPF